MDKIKDLYHSWLTVFDLHPYLMALGIVLTFTVFALIFNFVIICFLKQIFSKMLVADGDYAFNLLKKPLLVSLIIIGLAEAALVLRLPDNVLSVTTSFLKTTTIVVWAYFGIKLAKFLLNKVSGGEKGRLVQKNTLPLFSNLAIIIIIAAAVYFLFISWGIDVSVWLASAGIAGVALSFAAKDTLANLFAGVFILADAPYKLGDYIVLDSGERGQVTHIGIRSTRLLTRDDVEVTVPNSIMGNAKITNEAGGPSMKHRIRVKIGVAYGSDVDQVRKVLEQVAVGNQKVCKLPEPRVRFRGFGNSSLDVELLCWVDMPVLRGLVLDQLYTEVYKKFMELKIEIPYTKQDVYIKSMPPA